jgi:hypothetical protein
MIGPTGVGTDLELNSAPMIDSYFDADVYVHMHINEHKLMRMVMY